MDDGAIGDGKTVKQGKDSFVERLIYSGECCVNPAVKLIARQNTFLWSKCMRITFVSIMLSKSLNGFPGTKGEMNRLQQLFVGNKFDPQDQLKPQDNLLAIPINK